jgi:uncharacterized protein
MMYWVTGRQHSTSVFLDPESYGYVSPMFGAPGRELYISRLVDCLAPRCPPREKMPMKNLIHRLIALIVLAFVLPAAFLACSGNGETERVRFLSIVSGGQQGIYYPSAIQFANIASDSLPGVRITVETSGGSVANARLLGDGEADLATMQNDIAYYAVRGEGMFETAVEGLRGVTAMYPEVVQIVARRDSNIRSVADLRGRKVSIGAPGSGTELNARQILEEHGIALDDLGFVERLRDSEASDKLKDSHIEAAFFTYGLGAPVIMDMSVTTDIVVVGLEAAEKSSR